MISTRALIFASSVESTPCLYARGASCFGCCCGGGDAGCGAVAAFSAGLTPFASCGGCCCLSFLSNQLLPKPFFSSGCCPFFLFSESAAVLAVAFLPSFFEEKNFVSPTGVALLVDSYMLTCIVV